ncbi:MAG: Na+/H+ antiporter NhaA [Anaeromyxobacter sp. RBG_16_69_14]|nr:MAG: Na+/H+ antiporter NhaA [Anaeromyxobacter sp. RBG_16_69_14]
MAPAAPRRDDRRVPAIVFGAVMQPLHAFFQMEAASGIVLLACAIAALAWVNLGGAASYQAALDYPIALGLGEGSIRFTLHQAVNDGLMTVFFFVVGMEIKRELVLGELRTPAQAALPAIAALGGMAAPAGLYLAFNAGGPGQSGWGIPMATDIAFCIGVLTLLRTRVPRALAVFVTALAIFDDIGGILVIAFFYGQGLASGWLAGALAVTAALIAIGRAHVRSGLAYATGGALLWLALHHGGIHATIAGVVLGLVIPARPPRAASDAVGALAAHAQALLRSRRDEALDGEALGAIEERLAQLKAPLTRFVEALHPWVAFGVMPAFALANSGVDLRSLDAAQMVGPVAVGTAVALVAGKLVGISVFTWAAVKVGIAPMPGSVPLSKLLGVSAVAGIGFTVALFIAGLAFPGHPELLDQAKVGILAGSLVAGCAGAIVLRLTRALSPAAPAREGEPGGATAR